MSIHSHRSLPDDSQQQGISEIRLGDALGEDEKLREFLAALRETTNRDAPRTREYRLWETLKLCATAYTTSGWSMVTTAVRGGVEAFTNRLPSLVRERSMARERDLLVDSHAQMLDANAEKTRAEAELTRAQAQRVSAESEVLLAEAHEERQRTKRKDALLREIRKRNIDFLAGQQGSILRICCTKGSDDDPEENDS